MDKRAGPRSQRLSACAGSNPVRRIMVKILVFTEGTIIMHKSKGAIHDYASYVPIGNAAEKLQKWKSQGAELLYLTSRRTPEEVGQIKEVLGRNGFPAGELLFRRKDEEYKDVAEKVVPDILVEDDCESIGGAKEMTITHVSPEIRKRSKSVVVREFGGIDHLPDDVSILGKS